MSAIDAALGAIDRVAAEGDLAPDPSAPLELEAAAEPILLPDGRRIYPPMLHGEPVDKARLRAAGHGRPGPVDVPAADRPARLGQVADRAGDRTPAVDRPRPPGRAAPRGAVLRVRRDHRADLATAAGEADVLRERTQAEHDRAERAQAAADQTRQKLEGIVVGLLQAATPLALWWLDSATVYALGLAVIAAVYVGFAVADGRPKVIAVESSVTFAFVVVAAAAITGSPWLLVAGLAGHGLKDLWQHRTHFVANTRWWPPFCMIVDWVVAAIIVGEIAAGMHFG